MRIFNPPLYAESQSTPADPATTTSAVGVMMGLAGSITPTSTGSIEIIISGDIDNNTRADGAQVQIRTGTGAAPANGAALTGTAQGALSKMFNADATGLLVGYTPGRWQFSVNAQVTGLALGTAIWVDLSLAALSGGTARVRDISISIKELP